MKKVFLFISFLCISSLGFGQLGKSKPALLAEIGNENIVRESAGKPGYSSLLYKIDSTQFVQATFKGQQAVMLSYFSADSTLSEQQYKGYLLQSLPGFTPEKTCRLGNKTYLLDPEKNQMVVQSHRDDDTAFPLIGLILANDPAMISSMSEKIKQFCR